MLWWGGVGGAGGGGGYNRLNVNFKGRLGKPGENACSDQRPWDDGDSFSLPLSLSICPSRSLFYFLRYAGAGSGIGDTRRKDTEFCEVGIPRRNVNSPASLAQGGEHGERGEGREYLWVWILSPPAYLTPRHRRRRLRHDSRSPRATDRSDEIAALNIRRKPTTTTSIHHPTAESRVCGGAREAEMRFPASITTETGLVRGLVPPPTN